jgi:hypothetical protein
MVRHSAGQHEPDKQGLGPPDRVLASGASAAVAAPLASRVDGGNIGQPVAAALIAAGLVWMALENRWPRHPPWRRDAFTVVFRLVQGLGIAEALTVLQLSGWPLAHALPGFKLGVEGSQAVVMLAPAPQGSSLASCLGEFPRCQRGKRQDLNPET